MLRTSEPGQTSTPKSDGPREATPYRDKGGKKYSIRTYHKGHEIFSSGHASAAAARRAAKNRRTEIDEFGKPVGAGPDKTLAAQAMQDYALARLPFKKGAVQEAVRMNQYLRAAHLDTLVVTPVQIPQAASEAIATQNTGKSRRAGKKQAPKPAATKFFEVTLQPYAPERVIPQGLHAHRKAQLTKTANAQRHREVLATTPLSQVTRHQMQAYVDAMRAEGAAPATLALERSLWRVLLNYARTAWAWHSLPENAAAHLNLPAVDNVRTRVMSAQEQDLMDKALSDCRNGLVGPTVTLLRETAMRSSEPLEHACWRDVHWERQVLTLTDAKAGSREVPLSPTALQALREIGPGAPDAKIITITYEALRAAFGRACERAGIDDLVLHDLRRTAATRMALKTGNRFLVKALTGHKTDVMVERYIQVGADDVVAVFNQQAQEAAQAGAQASAPQETTEQMASAAAKGASAAVTLSVDQLQALMQQAVVSAMAAMQAAPTGAAVQRPQGGDHGRLH